MPVRLKKPYNGQAAGTMYFGADENTLRSLDIADDYIENATDYQAWGRTVTAATANVTRSGMDYLMTSGSPQTLTLGTTGWLPLGSVITISQMGAAPTTLTAGSGVTILTNLASLVTKGQYSIGQIKKISANTWLAFGGFGG